MKEELQQLHCVQSENQGKLFCTLKGWEICLSWKDGTTSWHPLSEVKNSFPLLLAKYAVTNELNDQRASAWWVPHTIKKEKRLVKAIKSCYSQRSHKFGIYVPKNVAEALEIDRQTKTTYWRDAIQKEMSNNRKAFQFLENHESVPSGYKWIMCHMIFDVKMDFTRKAHYVAGGHMTNPPSSLTYSSLVLRDSICFAFVLAALNDINLLATDIGNAHLNAPAREKVYTTAGPEVGPELEGKSILIVRALYGLNQVGLHGGHIWPTHYSS
jgi:hypothetical protein